MRGLLKKHSNERADTQIEQIISELRKIYSSLSKSEYINSTILVLNHLLGLYFRINNFQQCMHLFNVIQADLDNILGSIRLRERLSFHYYIARMYLFLDQLPSVVDHLQMALSVARTRRNRVKILRFLIPVQILSGVLPTAFLLKKYELFEFVDVVRAIRTGNVRLFDQVLQKFIRLWVDRGLYFLLVRAKKLLLRNLVKQVFLINGSKREIPLEMLYRAFELGESRASVAEEVNCILAGLCKNGFVKGYVLIDEKVLYLSNKNPFPFVPHKWNDNQF